jgi:hypothetical protein
MHTPDSQVLIHLGARPDIADPRVVTLVPEPIAVLENEVGIGDLALLTANDSDAMEVNV